MLAQVIQFQSTLPRGERRRQGNARTYPCQVSIHAPAWGATSSPRWSRETPTFQSTLPRGERPSREECGYPSACFNPRSRVGSDSAHPSAVACGCSFNPRSRVGSDRGWRSILKPIIVSIHAPAWGATLWQQQPCLRTYCFNPRSRVGSDLG